ncbi:MAG: FAD-dependent oxidoreductase [Pseudomonadota bacterium]
MSEIIKTDLCIIGAGSGGLSVAAGAAQMGVSTVLIERGKMGGDCLNYGCVPSKALIAAGKTAHSFRTATKFGVHATEPEIDFAAVKDHVADVIAGIAPHDSVERFEGLGVNVILGEGRFLDGKTVQVGDQKITARRFVIATGSRPMTLPIPGLDETPHHTNETIFEDKTKPDHLIVIGGGPIGMEMAQAHRRLGVQVTVLERFGPLGKDDPELTQTVLDALSAEGIKIMGNTAIERVAQAADGGVEVYIKDAEGDESTARIVSGSHLLVAAGRTPNIETLNLEAAGIEYTNRGIQVDARLRTSNKKIFAIGDCSGGLQFTHVAGYEAGVVIQNALFRIPAKAKREATPWVTFTDPELAHVGMTEASAQETHGDKVKVLKWEYAENDRARAERATDGLVKVVLHKNKIIGASIVGKQAGELLQPWIIAVDQGMKIRAMTSFIAPYPTLGEINKRAAGSAYTETLFSPRTKKIVKFLSHFG